ncbi:hypothetical protein AQUCO_01000641v1 [Aquilegia coerulea]|uniref:Uncharacterized protein n=1 Tax=Aquilegia coerulea TaxID=218851 RepID=A0A2G5EAX8_AQUCA|nr:hypothetical protein AQUCO_01000641v1 [Aquilegia coerulea]
MKWERYLCWVRCVGISSTKDRMRIGNMMGKIEKQWKNKVYAASLRSSTSRICTERMMRMRLCIARKQFLF